MKKLYLDAGTTWSKVIETNASEKSDFFSAFEKYLKFRKKDLNYYLLIQDNYKNKLQQLKTFFHH